MAYGLIPAHGNWERMDFDVDSTATFVKGALVTFGSALSVREYASTDSQYLGISAHSSTNSLPSGKVTVFIPTAGCTAWSDLTTGITNSQLSRGIAVCLYKQGNYMSYTSTVMGHASRFSALATVVGPIRSDTSQVEIAFNVLTGTFWSASSHTYAS